MNWLSNTMQQQKFLVSYCLLAGLSFFTTLFLQYVGEESTYAIAALEMLYNHHHFIYTIYNVRYNRPPLLIWFISPLTALMGWKYVLIASRLVTLLATLATAAVLFGLCLKLSKNRFLAWLSVAIFFTGDLLFTRGWLAYSDSLFSLCIFLSIACLWIAVQEQKRRWVVVAIFAIMAAFLTKALTVYVFYGVAAFILLVYHPNRKFLLQAPVITLHLIAILMPVIWLLYVNSADRWMISDILDNASTPATLVQHLEYLALQPLRLLRLFAPPLFLVAYLAIRRRINYAELPKNTVKILAWILLINYLPYCISIKAEDRYLMPLYPLMALMLAYLIYASRDGVRLLCWWLIPTLILKWVVGCWGLYYYENYYRSNYHDVALQVLQITQDQPLYSSAVESTGLSIAANIDVIRESQRAPLAWPTDDLQNGFMMNSQPQSIAGAKLYKQFSVKGSDLYLFCKGSACDTKAVAETHTVR